MLAILVVQTVDSCETEMEWKPLKNRVITGTKTTI
jgi:hypothetical protein